MNLRLKSLIDLFKSKDIDALIVNCDVNIQYLTQFPAHESWLFVTPKQSFYITDARYTLEAEKGLKGIQVVRFEKSLFHTVVELALKHKLGRIGFDETSVTLAQYKSFVQNLSKSLKLVAANGLVENLREVKSREEILRVRQALKIHHEALKLMKRVVKPGITEQNVLEKLENFVKVNRVGHSFSPIIASGPNSCFPHAKVTNRKIKNNEPVLLDFGIDYKGYKSDLTRMIFLGRIPQFVRDINEKVYCSQQKAIRAIKAGIDAKLVDAQARNYLKEYKLDQYFGHSLGHGVGLEIHENPRLSQGSKAILKEGMVVTVEPAVYIPHQFGIRLEEMVLVRKNDCEVLSVGIN